MRKRAGFDGRLAVRMLCALALLLVGFAHKPPVAAAHVLTPAELALYALPDGTIPDLCVTSEDDGSKQNNHKFGSGCEACRLSASVVLPQPADIEGEPVLRVVDRFVPVRIEAFYRQLFPPNAVPRGPPSGLTV